MFHLEQHINNSFQNYFYKNVEVPNNYAKLEVSHKKLNTYSRDGHSFDVKELLKTVENWNDSKKAVIVLDEYQGIKSHLFCPKNAILFTSNEASDKIVDNIIHIPLLNNTEISAFAYKPIEERKYLYSFVGSRTHYIRKDIIKILKADSKAFILEENRLSTVEFNDIIADSIFTLAPRGVNMSSYRICEALKNGSIPVYVSDDFILPENFEEYGIIINSYDIEFIPKILRSYSNKKIKAMVERGKAAYKELFTYEGLSNWIVKKLKTFE